MVSQLVCRPERQLPIGVLRVAGVLDKITNAALQHAVRSSLAAQPQALIIDVADLDVDDPSALDVLSSVLEQTAQWAPAPIVLCSATAETAGCLADSTAGRQVELAGNCDEVLDRLAAEPPPRRIRVRLRPVPGACRQARQLVSQACTTWRLGALTSTAALVATELVANVVRHAHTGMEFTLGLRDGRFSLAVRDGSTVLPCPVDAMVSNPGGRGLRLVRDLTDAWGVLPLIDGKVIWTILATPRLG